MKKILLGVDKLLKLGLLCLIDLPTKSYYYIKVNGFGAYLKKILLSMVELFVKHREAVLLENDLSKIPELIHPKIGVDIQMGTDNDVPRLRRLLPQYSARIFRNRLSRGDILFIAQIDSRIIHQVWITFRDKYVPLLNRRIILRQEETYRYHGYTDPEFRSRNVATAVRGEVLGYLRAHGYRKSFFLVDLKTHRLTKGRKKIFASKKETLISYWRIFGYKNYRYQPYRGFE